MAPDRTDRPVAILLGLDEEARGLIHHLARSTISSPHLPVWEGVVESKSVVLVVTGVGKVSAAMAAQFICDVFAPPCFLSGGLPGATDSDWQRGQLGVSSVALQPAVDAPPVPPPNGLT